MSPPMACRISRAFFGMWSFFGQIVKTLGKPVIPNPYGTGGTRFAMTKVYPPLVTEP